MQYLHHVYAGSFVPHINMRIAYTGVQRHVCRHMPFQSSLWDRALLVCRRLDGVKPAVGRAEAALFEEVGGCLLVDAELELVYGMVA